MIECILCNKDLEDHTETQAFVCLKRVSKFKLARSRIIQKIWPQLPTIEQHIEMQTKSHETWKKLILKTKEFSDPEQRSELHEIARTLNRLDVEYSKLFIFKEIIDLDGNFKN